MGEYLLHVRLRQQAVALPGSPFNLSVMPGPAHALSTTLPAWDGNFIDGTVGMGGEDGCGIVITTADVMGNACIHGGATVTCDAFGTPKGVEVVSKVDDVGDGSYRLNWNCMMSGTFQVAIKIHGEHVVGSPTLIKLISTQPELSRSELVGTGLGSAIAGQPAAFDITFYDQYGNAATPDESFKLGLALLKSGDKDKAPKPHDDFSMRCKDPEEGLFEVSFTATKDGSFDLHVWAEDTTAPPPPAVKGADEGDAKAERVAFPNSPFHCMVQSGAASPHKSFVDGWTKESRAVDKHGKAVQQARSFHGLPRPSMAFHGLPRPSMPFSDLPCGVGCCRTPTTSSLETR